MRLQAENEAKTRLFAAAVHDLRQPLQALMLFSEALGEEKRQSLEQLRRVARVRQSVASLDRLCADLLNLSQIDAGQLAPRTGEVALTPLFDELRHTFRPVALERGLRLVVRPCANWVRGDGVMLTRILNNLVCNAIRHTASGGVLVGARRSGDCVRIDVCDTGVGIAPEQQSQVFRAFYPAHSGSADSQGYGLGLATVRQLAELQGAKVVLRSRPDRGTTVSIFLTALAAMPAGPG